METKDRIIKYCDRIIILCLCLLIFCLPFAKAPMQVFNWLAIAVWIIKKAVVYKTIHLPKTKLNKTLFLFFFVCAISALLSINSSLSLKALFTKIFKQILLYFVIVDTVYKKNRFNNILLAISLSAVLIIADSAVQYFRGIDFLRGYTKFGTRLQASFGNPNGFGGWLILIMPILFSILLYKEFIKSNIKKIGIFIIWLALLACLVLTQSRAVWLGFILSFGLLNLYLISIVKMRIKIIFLVIIILLSTAMFFTVSQPIKDRIASIMQIKGSSLFRIQLWEESLSMIKDFPLFGVGLNTYTEAGRIYKKAGGGFYPHNSYLQMAAEIGIIGLCAFLLIILKLFMYGFGILRSTNDKLLLGLFLAIVAFLTQSFFDVNLYALQLATLFWFILGLSMARINMITNTQNIAT